MSEEIENLRITKEDLMAVMSLHFAARCKEAFDDRCLAATRGMDVAPFRSHLQLVQEAKNSTRSLALGYIRDREEEDQVKRSRKIEALLVTPSEVERSSYPIGSTRDVTYLILGW